MRRAAFLIVAALLASPAHAAPLALKAQPALSKDNSALPRIAAPDAAGVRINAALAKVDASWRAFGKECAGQSDQGDTSTGRHVETTLAGPDYLSLLVRYDYYCGGAYPDTGTLALVYDLRTGRPVNWQAVLPKALATTAKLSNSGDGVIMGLIASPALTRLYLKAADTGEPSECDLSDSDRELNFIVWMQKGRGIGLEPADFPHALKACAEPRIVSLQALAKAGVSPALLQSMR